MTSWFRKIPLGMLSLTALFIMSAWVILAIRVDDVYDLTASNVALGLTAPPNPIRNARGDVLAGKSGSTIVMAVAPVTTTAKAGNVTTAANGTNPESFQDGWTLLPGNVTVHEGFEANPHNFSYMLNTEKLCQDLDPRKLKVLVFVESHVRNSERRLAIRRTWAQRSLQKALNFRVVFLFANDRNPAVQDEALKEHYTYGDVSQEDFLETFENLTIKSVMGLKYAVSFCRNVDFVVKIDDDIYLHLPNLIKSLEHHKRTPFKDSLLCHRNRVRKILRPGKSLEELRIKTMKYEVPHHLIPGETFPTYCSGFSYAMSLNAARRLYEASLGTPLFFIEDVYITGFCRHKARLQLKDHEGFTLRPSVTGHNAPCNFLFTERITSNEIGPEEMFAVWNSVNTQGYFCPH